MEIMMQNPTVQQVLLSRMPPHMQRPEVLRAMMANPEVKQRIAQMAQQTSPVLAERLRNPRVMQAVLEMTRLGPEALKQYEGDKDVLEAAMEAGTIIQQMQQEKEVQAALMEVSQSPWKIVKYLFNKDVMATMKEDYARGTSEQQQHQYGRSFLSRFISPLGNMHSKINRTGGSCSPDDFKQEGQVLSSFYQEGIHGGLGLRFRRKVPMFQVLEFHANGTAFEQYKARTPQELGLHPRDVTLFAPLSRLAAPQRATIIVHESKILVKTEVVKAIITADKAVLIKGRRGQDTQKLAQAILAANDQRLMAIALAQQRQQQTLHGATSRISLLSGSGCGKAAAAAEVLSQSHTPAYVRRGPHGRRPAVKAGQTDTQNPGDTAAGGRFGVGSDLADTPFEMLVLEVLLDATAEYFYTKVQHLHWMLESLSADIRQGSPAGQSQGALDKAHQLIPIQKFLTSVKNDVRETKEAITAALVDNETLAELCLSWHQRQKEQQRWREVQRQRRRAHLLGEEDEEEEPYGIAADEGSPYSVIYGNTMGLDAGDSALVACPNHQVKMLTEMLESYQREIQSLEGSIHEAEEDLDHTRSLWHMQLDSSRNHIIMVNLWLSMLNISVMATTIVPAFFGMNLASGLSDTEPALFYLVCGCSVLLAALSYPASRYWYNRNWRKVNNNEVFERRMLRMLLVQNVEDVDAVISALKRYRYSFVDRKLFKQLLLEVMGSRAKTAHIDLLWQAFDRNRDGFLEEAALIRPLNTYHTSSVTDYDAVSIGGASSISNAALHVGPRPSRAAAAAAAAALDFTPSDYNYEPAQGCKSGKVWDEGEMLRKLAQLSAHDEEDLSRHGGQAGEGSTSMSTSADSSTAAPAPAAATGWLGFTDGVLGLQGLSSSSESSASVASQAAEVAAGSSAPGVAAAAPVAGGLTAKLFAGQKLGSSRWRKWRHKKLQKLKQNITQHEQQQAAGHKHSHKPHTYPGEWMNDERFTWD
eukprot:gene5093-5334_t